MRHLAIIGFLIFGISACSTGTSTQSVNKTPVSETAEATSDSLVAPSEHRRPSLAETSDQEKPASDEQVTADIRAQMMDSKMSVNLQKIKVNTQNGKVTLTGVVKTPEEKQKAGEIAQSIAGSAQVDNWVEVE